MPDVEKQALRAELEAFMSAHPVRTAATARPIGEKPSIFAVFAASLLRPVPIAIVLVLALGTGTASAAERALPVDPLYFVKIHVNEPVRRALAVTPEAKAGVETALAVRRLDEAQALAAAGKLDARARAVVETGFEAQAERARAEIAAVGKAKGGEAAASLANALETALVVRADGFGRSNERRDDARAELKPVLDRVQAKTDALREERRAFEAGVRVKKDGSRRDADERDRGGSSESVPPADLDAAALKREALLRAGAKLDELPKEFRAEPDSKDDVKQDDAPKAREGRDRGRADDVDKESKLRRRARSIVPLLPNLPARVFERISAPDRDVPR